MDKKNTTESVRFTLDVPSELNKKLVSEAVKEKRSRHAQILMILENSFGNGNGSHRKNGEKKKEA